MAMRGRCNLRTGATLVAPRQRSKKLPMPLAPCHSMPMVTLDVPPAAGSTMKVVTTWPSADRAIARDQCQSPVERPAQGQGGSARLRENETALDAGQRRGGEPGDIRIGPKLAGLDHGRKAGADAGLPAVEPRRQHGPDAVVTLTELAEEIGDRAAPLAAPFLLEGDERVGPPDQPVPGAEVVKEIPLAT